MEVLLAACLLAWAAGAQSEQAKLGISPAQRAVMREQTRHEKAVRKIGEKHGSAPPASAAGVSPWKKAPEASAGSVAVTVPEAFRSGYRAHTPLARVTTPVGRHAGNLTARGVDWVRDTGRSAVTEYRKRRKAAGEPDPAPILIPMPPASPPHIPAPPGEPPVPTAILAPPDSGPSIPAPPSEPPTVGVSAGEGGAEGKAPDPEGVPLADGRWLDDSVPDRISSPRDPEKPLEGAPEPLAADEGTSGGSEAPTGPESAPEGAAPVPGPRTSDEASGVSAPESEPEAGRVPVPDPPPEPAGSGGLKTTTDTQEGVGRMAAEVTYDSVADESDELSLMCDDDVRVYGRIRTRAEREVGRGDSLIALLENTGFGPGIIGWVARCQENYRVIHGEIDGLQANTIAQGETVVRAKGLLEAGQGVYADIALDMESVAEREAYISDAVDAEDTSAHTEIYETKGA